MYNDIFIRRHMCVYLYIYIYIYLSHRLPDGVGTNGFFTEGSQIPYMLLYVALSANVLPYVVTCCPHFP